jgi:hypothetical protein
LNAEILGAKHRGEWRADFSVQPAVCSGSGRLSRIALARLAETMQDAWISGIASGSYEVKGPCSGDFWHSAEGTLQFEVKDGTLPHLSLAGDEAPLKIARLSGEARLHGGKFEMQDATLNSASGTFQLSGTASLKRELNLKLSRTASGVAAGYSITGTLAAPHVAPLPETEQARLKP